MLTVSFVHFFLCVTAWYDLFYGLIGFRFRSIIFESSIERVQNKHCNTCISGTSVDICFLKGGSLSIGLGFLLGVCHRWLAWGTPSCLKMLHNLFSSSIHVLPLLAGTSHSIDSYFLPGPVVVLFCGLK